MNAKTHEKWLFHCWKNVLVCFYIIKNDNKLSELIIFHGNCCLNILKILPVKKPLTFTLRKGL